MGTNIYNIKRVYYSPEKDQFIITWGNVDRWYYACVNDGPWWKCVEHPETWGYEYIGDLYGRA